MGLREKTAAACKGTKQCGARKTDRDGKRSTGHFWAAQEPLLFTEMASLGPVEFIAALESPRHGINLTWNHLVDTPLRICPYSVSREVSLRSPALNVVVLSVVSSLSR